MIQWWTIFGKGAIDNKKVSIEDGIVRTAPPEVAHWVGRSWTWVLEKIGAYGWRVERDLNDGSS